MTDEAVKLVDALVEVGFCATTGEAMRLIRGGGAKVNDQREMSLERTVVPFDTIGAGKMHAALFRPTPEPAQPAESPEARARARLKALVDWAEADNGSKFPGVCPDDVKTLLAATTARPTERGAVEAHFARMQDMMRQYVEPCTYVASFPKDSSKWESEFPEPQPDQSSVARLNCKARRDAAFIADMIHMMDGPEQRALTPPVTVAATDQAGEVERAFRAGFWGGEGTKRAIIIAV